MVLVLAYVYQLKLYELPCPLCLLQRVGFVAVGVGLGLNLLYGARPQHYAIMLLAALFGGSVAVRQILLHIVPGTGHYGSPVLGLHYYTWSAICFFLILLGTAFMLLFDRQYAENIQQPAFWWQRTGQKRVLYHAGAGGAECDLDTGGMRAWNLRRPTYELQND